LGDFGGAAPSCGRRGSATIGGRDRSSHLDGLEQRLATADSLRRHRDAAAKHVVLGLVFADELAFYDAVGGPDMAAIMGDAALLAIARQVARTVRENTKSNWDKRESVPAQTRVAVRRVLRRHKYPPGRTDDATETVVRQAEHLTADLAA